MKKIKRIKTRHIWHRNPKTQIVPNKKHKIDKNLSIDLLKGQKITERDLDELDEVY